MMNETLLKPAFEKAAKEIQARRRSPRATYRLQFNSKFTLRQAEALVPYLHDLGISEAYASPLLTACPGSEHGYDICDHSRLNPNLGEEADLEAFVAALQAREMGLILDTVPNHMGISIPQNAWWMDVLENGPGSLYATYFDIDWQPLKTELENKVLLPILEDQYGRVLESGKLRLAYEEGAFFIYYYENKLPVAPRSYSVILTKALDSLVESMVETDEDLQEFRSILTALGYLPPPTAQEGEALEERNREKEVIKRRLASLTGANPTVAAAIETVVAGLNGKPGKSDSFDELHALIEAQSYRLAFWRVAAEEINYRRFFDINSLAAIRVELPQVFADTHALIFRWLGEGKVTGLRIDHPDGLWSPAAYFKALQANYLQRQLEPRLAEVDAADLEQSIVAWLEAIQARWEKGEGARPDTIWPLYVVAEKILSEDEPLPQDWAIDGTTGYDFLNDANGLFINRDNERAFNRIYRRFTEISTPFEEVATQTKEMIMRVSLASEINLLAHQLERIVKKSRRYRDFTLNSVTVALREVLACLSIYRTYVTPPHPVTARDEQYIKAAVAEAKRRNPSRPSSLLNFLQDILLLRNLEDFEPEDRDEIVAFVMKFQQVSGPLTAKGLEDTAFYIYNRLTSLNEVGGHPERFGLPVEEFHRRNEERLAYWPHTMLASSTHDTKRSEDVRARLNVLSELPGEWQKALSRWSRLNAVHKTKVDGQFAPDRNDEYLFYQAVLGAWPFAASTDKEGPDLMPPDSPALAEFRERILAYMQKATNEAKTHTSWINPNDAYDAAIDRFVCDSLEPKRAGRFLKELLVFAGRVAYYGQFNSLAQLLLKLTAPGVPDIYQGTELWDFSLVDPDNRRPVDYEQRRGLLADLKQQLAEGGPEQQLSLARALLETSQDGRIKLYVLERALAFRRDQPDLFNCGDYQPLEAAGPKGSHMVAFSRTLEGQKVVVVVPRLIVGLTEGVEQPPLGEVVWGESWLSLPGEPPARRYLNLFTGQTLQLQQSDHDSGLPLKEIFTHFPVALLAPENHPK